MNAPSPLRARFSVPADHACLPGHFPGRPVVPGVVLLDHAFALILAGRPDQRVAVVDSVKFLSPVLPEESVEVEWFESAPGRVGFRASVADRAILRGQARLGAA